jgi:glycosyltransferase involved in cell wall biosynthesis
VREFLEDGTSLWIALGVSGLLFLLFLRAWFNVKALPVLQRAQGTRAADCMVVIPARDEEDVIERAVRSLPHDTVIVVDDGSSDATARFAREAGAGVLPAPPLQRGGTGKANACAAGALPLKSRWILFADADTWFEAGFLEAAVAASEASGVSFLSVYPKPCPVGFLEHTLTPYLRALYFAGTNPKSSPAHAFNGQVVLARRETYEFLGGHNAILREAVDDIRLAMLAERHRVKYAIAQAPELCHTRMYRGLRGMWRGLERQAVRFHIGNPLRALVSLLAAAIGLLWLPVLVWLLLDRQWIAAACLALVPTVCLRYWYGSTLRSLLAPLAIYIAIPFLAHAFMAGFTGRPVLWKGRRV